MNAEQLVTRDLIKEEFDRSLFTFCKYGLGYKDVNFRTHGGMIKNLESDSRRKLLVLPRGCLKSSVGVVGYAIWMLTKNPNLRIMIDSELYGNSKNFIREIRHKLESPLLKELYGNWVGQTWGEGEITIAQRIKGFKEASVVASGVEAGKTGLHFDLIIHDDLNSKDNSKTPEARQKVIDHYRLNTSILEPDGTMVVIGTRYAADDVIGWILDNEVNQ